MTFTPEEMLDIQLLAKWYGIPLDDYGAMATLVGQLVREKLDSLRQPKERGEKP